MTWQTLPAGMQAAPQGVPIVHREPTDRGKGTAACSRTGVTAAAPPSTVSGLANAGMADGSGNAIANMQCSVRAAEDSGWAASAVAISVPPE